MFRKAKKQWKVMQQLRLGDMSISAEQIRMIRTRLESKMTGRPCVVMVTSPDSMKQKSLISSKLALSFAEQGRKVLLIDSNVRDPKVHEWFQVDNQRGWTNAYHSSLHSPLDFVPDVSGRTVHPHHRFPHTSAFDVMASRSVGEMGRGIP